MPQTDDLLERIRRIRQMAAQEAALSVEREGPPLDRFPQSVPPSRPPRAEDNVPGPLRLAEQPYVKAELLEEEARPMPEPGGWRGIGEAALRGLAGSSHPGGYHGYRADLDARERQRQQDLLARAQRLRAEGLQRDQMNRQIDQDTYSRERDAINFKSQDDLRRAQIGEIQHRQNQPMEVTAGASLMRPTGEVLGTAPPNTQSNTTENDTVVTEDKGVLQWNPATKRYDIRVGDRPRSPVSQARPGSMQPVVDAYGNITAMVDTETGAITPAQIPPGLGNVRKTGAPAGENLQRAMMDTMLEDLTRLRQLGEANRGAIGPIEGRLAAVKRLTIGENAEVNELFRIADNLADQLLRARSGAQINEQEYSRLRTLVPNPRLPEGRFFSDLDGFERELQRILDKRQGAAPLGQTGNSSTTTTTSPTSNTGQDVQPRRTRIKLQ